MLSDRDRQVVL